MKKMKIIQFKEKGIIRLDDLMPIEDVMGGSGKVLFGERFEQNKTYHLVRKKKIKKAKS